MSDHDAATHIPESHDHSDPTGPGAPTRIRWLIFALASLTSWFLYLHRYTWNFIRPELKSEYGFTNIQLETIYTAFSISYGIGQIPSGIICDFFGPHFFLGVIIALWSLTLMLFGSASSIGGFSGIRFLFGATQAGCYPSLSKVTRLWFPLKTRTIVQGFIASFFGRSGGAMSSIIMGTLLMGMLGLGWRASLFVMGGAGMLFAAAFLWLYRNQPETDRRVNDAERLLIRGEDEISGDGPRVMPIRRALKNRSLLVLILQQIMNAGADGIYTFLMGSYFLEAKNVDIGTAGLLVSLPLWGGAIGGIAGGFVNDGLIYLTGSRRWSRAAAGLSGKAIASGMMFVAISQTGGVATAWCLFVVKFFTDWTQPTVWGTCTDMGGRYSATVFSIINTAGSVGGVIFAPVVGIILDRFTTQQHVDGVTQNVTNYTPVFVIVAGMYIVSALCWLFIDCTNSLDENPAPAKDCAR
jgi:ACS family glucarate transporter-like MFS transporter